MKPTIPFRFYLFLILYTLLFLFYPGDSYYFKIFAYQRPLFKEKINYQSKTKINSFPIIKNNYFPEITAQSIYIVDLNSFTPVYEKNARKKFLPASTTKIITALVAYDVYKPNKVLIVKRVINNGHIMGLTFNEKITVENLLYGTLVHSGNDAAYALADGFGYNDFIQLMNKKAKDLKMINTHFQNPAGFDHPLQYTTAFDLALAGRELLKNKYLSKIVATKEIIISDVDFKYFHKLTNVNKLLGKIQGIGGLKTGYTENAGENLVSLFKNNSHQFIIVILKSKDRFSDTEKIINWIKENVEFVKVDI